MKNNKIFPPYVWITILMVLVIITYVLDLCQVIKISDTRLLGLFGFIIGWLGLYDIKKRVNQNEGDHDV